MFTRIRRIFRRPMRYWLVSLLVLMLIVRLVWGWWVHRQLEAQISAIRARGEPTDPSQIVHQPVPDNENAVVVYRQAVSVVNERVDCPRNSNLNYSDYFPRSSKWMEL